MLTEKVVDIVKCVIFDLDDTLWKGVLLEDGSVSIPEEHRSALLELVNRGIVLSIASKNEHSAVKRKLETAGLWHLFAFPKANYIPKSQNIAQIISELQLRPGNVAFIDDNHFNLAEVEGAIQDIQVYDAINWTSLLNLPQFNPANTSSETSQRATSYKINEKRKSLRADFSKYEDFLSNCNIECDMYQLHEEYIPRVLELINRTNQLNFTKSEQGRNESYLRNLIQQQSGYIVNVHDKFGDHGIVGFFSLDRNQITDFVFSCRVLSMYIEDKILHCILDKMKSAGIDEATVLSNNESLASSALTNAGFISNNGLWRVKLDSYASEKMDFIKLSAKDDIYRKKKLYVANGAPKIFLKGGCDLLRIFGTVKERARLQVNTEASRYEWIDNLNKGTHTEHSSRLVCSLDMTEADREFLRSMIGKLPSNTLNENESDYDTTWAHEDYDIFVWTPIMDATQCMYRFVGTDIIVTCGAYDVITKFPKCERDKYEILGPITEHEFINNMNRIFSVILEKKPSRHIVVLTSNEHDPIKDNKSAIRKAFHKTTNDWLYKLASHWKQLHIVDVNEVTSLNYEGFRDIRHYDSKTYMQIGEKLLSCLDDIAG